MRCVAVVVVCLVFGCSANEVIDVTYDPCSELVIVPAEGTSATELASIEEAVSAWGEVIPTWIEVGDARDGAPALPMTFDSGDTFYRAMYWDQTGEVSISRDNLASDDYALAIAHELGHAFGLFHVGAEVRPSVMNVHNLEIAPNDEDGRAVSALWDACADDAGLAEPDRL